MLKFVCCFLVLCAGMAVGQDQASALKAARELAGAVKMGDMEWMVDRMYPQIRATAARQLKGGDRELKSKYKKLGEDLKQKGVVFESFHVDEPFGVYVVKLPVGRQQPENIANDPTLVDKSETIVILPTRMVISVKDPQGKIHKVEKTSFLYAVAKAVEKDKWYFIDGTTYTLNQMRNIFYDLPTGVPLPPVSERPIQ